MSAVTRETALQSGTQAGVQGSLFRAELVLGGVVVVAACSYALAGPQGATVVAGQVNIKQQGNLTTINAGNNSIINFQSFNLNQNETVRYIQPNSDSRVLNQISGAAPSYINGTILANGQVYFMNPAGVTFGPNSVVNVGTLIAGAGTISNADFLRGVDRFTALNGAVANYGDINARAVALLGRQVSNFGNINAPEGTVIMVSGGDVLIGRKRDRIFAKISAAGQAVGESRAGVTNAGRIQAGDVSLVASDIYGAAIFNPGRIRAQRATINSGSNGTTVVTGQIDVSNQSGQGGQATILGEQVELRGATIDASGSAGGGEVLIGGGFRGQGTEVTSKRTGIDENTTINARATDRGDGGRVAVWADEQTIVRGSFDLRGGQQAGNGGFIEISGGGALSFNGYVTAAGPRGANGTLLFDPKNITIVTGGTDGATGITFNLSPSADFQIDPTDITALTNAGTNVTLQANNDITVTSAISTFASGAGGNLTLRAGRSIAINASITTDNGNLSLTASDNSAQLANRDAGGGSITIGSGVTLNVGAGTLLFNFDSAVFAPGTLSIDPTAVLTAATTQINGIIRGNTASDDILVRASGILQILANTKIQGRTITLRSGAGQSLIFGAGVQLSSPTGISVRAGTGTGSTAALTGLGNVAFRDGEFSNGSPISFTMRQDATIADGLIPLASDFGDNGTGTPVLPTNYVIQSDGGTVTLTTAGKVAGTNLSLIGGTGVTLSTGLTLNSLLLSDNGSGGAISVGASQVITGSRTQTVGGSSRTFGFYSEGTTFTNTGGQISTSNSGIILNQSGGSTLAASLDAGSSFIRIIGGANQTGGTLSAGALSLGGTGNYTLNQSNAVGTLGAVFTGTLALTNTPLLNIGAAGSGADLATGINTGGNNAVTLVNTGLIAISNNTNVDAGTARVTFRSSGATQGTGSIITASELALSGSAPGAFTLQGANSIGTLAASTIGAVRVTTSGALTVGALTGVPGGNLSGISTTNNVVTLNAGGLLTLSQNVTAGSGAVSLTGLGISQTSGSLSTGGGLTVVSTGVGNDIVLNSLTNSFNNITGSSGRAINVYSLTGYAIAGSGLSAVTTNRLGSNGNVAINQPISGTTISLITGGATQSGSGTITASNLYILGSGTFNLGLAGNDVGTLAFSINLGSLRYDDANSLTIGTVSDSVFGPIAVSQAATASAIRAGLGGTGALTISQSITILGGLLHLQAANGAINQTTGNITSSGLLYRTTGSGGNVTLTSAGNALTSLAGTASAAVSILSTGTLTVTSLTDPVSSASVVGALANGADITIQAPTLTLNQTVDASNAGAGSSVVNLITDNLAVNATVRSGNSVTSGVWVRSITSGRGMSLGVDNASAVSLDATELGRFTTPVLQLGSASTGAITTTNLALTGVGYDLVLRGSGITTGGIQLSAPRTLTFRAETDGVNQTGGTIVVGNLRLLGNGAFVLNQAGNDVTNIGAATGAGTGGATGVTFRDTNSVNVTSVTSRFIEGGQAASSSGIVSGNGDVIVTTGTNVGDGLNVTSSTPINAGSGKVTLNTDNIAIFANVIGNSGITIQPVTSGRETLIGGTGPDDATKLTLRQSELDFLQSNPGDVIIGNSQVNQASTQLFTFSGPNLTISGRKVVIGQNITLGSGRLTLNTVQSVAQATGTGITAQDLLILGSGDFILTSPTNDFTNVAGLFNGNLRLNDVNTLTVGTVNGYSGLFSTGGNIALLTGGALTINTPIGALTAVPVGVTNPSALAAGVLTLQSTGVTQAARILAGDLIVSGSGDVLLNNSQNQVSRLAGSLSSGRLTLTTTNAVLTIDQLSDFSLAAGAGNNAGSAITGSPFNGLASDGFTLTGNSVVINRPLDGRGFGSQIAASNGISQSADGVVNASSLTLTGSGDANLDTADNTVGAINGTRTGNFNYTGATAFTVGNLSTVGGNIYLQGPAITFNGFTEATGSGNAGQVRISTNSIAINNFIVGPTGILVRPRGVGADVSIGVGDGAPGTLQISTAGLGRLFTNGTVQIGSSITGLITTGDVDFTFGLGRPGYDLTLYGRQIVVGGLKMLPEIGGPPLLARGEVGPGPGPAKVLSLWAYQDGVQQTIGSVLDAPRLLLLGSGPFTLTNTGNKIGTVSGNVAGVLQITNSQDLTVDTVSGLTLSTPSRSTGRDPITTSGLTSGDNTIIVIAPNLLAQQNINAGQAGVVLTTSSDTTVNSVVTGNAVTIRADALRMGSSGAIAATSGLLSLVIDKALWTVGSTLSGSTGVSITTRAADRLIQLGGTDIDDDTTKLALADTEVRAIQGGATFLRVFANGNANVQIAGGNSAINLSDRNYELRLQGQTVRFERGLSLGTGGLSINSNSVANNATGSQYTVSTTNAPIAIDGSLTTQGESQVAFSSGTAAFTSGPATFNVGTAVNAGSIGLTSVLVNAFSSLNSGSTVTVGATTLNDSLDVSSDGDVTLGQGTQNINIATGQLTVNTGGGNFIAAGAFSQDGSFSLNTDGGQATFQNGFESFGGFTSMLTAGGNVLFQNGSSIAADTTTVNSGNGTIRFQGDTDLSKTITLTTTNVAPDAILFAGAVNMGPSGVPLTLSTLGSSIKFGSLVNLAGNSTINTRFYSGTNPQPDTRGGISVVELPYENPRGGQITFSGNINESGGGLTLLTPLVLATGSQYALQPQIRFDGTSIFARHLRINTDLARQVIPNQGTVAFGYGRAINGSNADTSVSVTNELQLGFGERISAFGGLSLTADTMQIGDMNVLSTTGSTAALALNANTIEVWTRAANKVPGAVSPSDPGTSIVAQGPITLGGSATTFIAKAASGEFAPGDNNRVYVLLPSNAAFVFTNPGAVIQAKNPFAGETITQDRVLRLTENQNAGRGILPPPISGGELFNYLVAAGDDRAGLAEALAGAVTVEKVQPVALEQAELSQEQTDKLKKLGVTIRGSGEEDAWTGAGAQLIATDLPKNPKFAKDKGTYEASKETSDYLVSMKRLPPNRVQALLRDFDALFPNADTIVQLQKYVLESWNAYSASGAAQPLSGSGFREFLSGKIGSGQATEAERMTADALDKARNLFGQIDQLGLSRAEAKFPKTTIVESLVPSGDEVDLDLRDKVLPPVLLEAIEGK